MEYKLIKEHRKTLSVKICDAEVVVKAPIFMNKSDIEGFISRNCGKIEKMKEMIKEKNKLYASCNDEELLRKGRDILAQRVPFWEKREYSEKSGFKAGSDYFCHATVEYRKG